MPGKVLPSPEVPNVAPVKLSPRILYGRLPPGLLGTSGRYAARGFFRLSPHIPLHTSLSGFRAVKRLYQGQGCYIFHSLPVVNNHLVAGQG